jgi:dihydrolipoamide dehydrogenase
MKYDVIVIGSGPGGYVSAIRNAQLGKKTALIEKYNTLGGTCLNVGCIPSKALLDSSEHFHQAKKDFKEHGIEINEPTVNMEQMVNRKNGVVETTTGGIDFLMKKNKIDVHHGMGSFVDATHVKVTKEDGEEILEGTNIIIATGSKPIELPFAKFDKEGIISSTEALNIKEVPNKMIVIGGGVIGLEMGSVYARLGTEVTIVEFAPKLIPTMDGTLSKELQKVMKKLGMKINTNTKVSNVSRKGDVVTVTATNKKGEEVKFEADYCLVAVGRKAYTEGLGLENAGVNVTDRGQVEVNNQLQTNVSNIYAIGDVVRGAMLAHKAEEEGTVVAEYLAGEKPHMDYNLIPGIVYTWPEVGAVGKTEEELIEEGVEYKMGSFPMRALGRSRASGDTDGIVKILADKTTDEVLGVHMVAARAADMIMEAATAMEFRASAEDMARICHGHPTFTEAIKEAALDATGKRSIHS